MKGTNKILLKIYINNNEGRYICNESIINLKEVSLIDKTIFTSSNNWKGKNHQGQDSL